MGASPAGDVLFAARYDAFGEQEVLAGSAEVVPFGFAGGRYDAETGLVRFGARDYDPGTGRWTAKDPIQWGGQQANLYLYAGGDVVNQSDSNGRFILDWNDSIGALVGFSGVLLGGALPSVGWNGSFPVLEFEHSPLQALAGSSTTYGNVICYGGSRDDLTRTGAPVWEHEYAHVQQHDLLGGTYLPANALAQLFSGAATGSYDGLNAFEWGPYDPSGSPHPWPW